jgi:hypothetical protein
MGAHVCIIRAKNTNIDGSIVFKSEEETFYSHVEVRFDTYPEGKEMRADLRNKVNFGKNKADT